jgi:type IV pilus assembly protein PilC
MAEFLVRAADERGHVMEHAETGVSAHEVRDRFSQQGYLVYSVRPRGLLTVGQITVPRRRKVKLADFVIFNQQFVTLIRAGLPIAQALDLLSRRQQNTYLRSLLENVRDRVKSGELLSSAFEAQGVFPKVYTTTLMAGEKSGNMEEVLGRYIGFQRMALSFRKKLISSLIYPAILVIGVIVMFTVLVTWVVPQFGELFTELNVQLPAITVFTLGIGHFVTKYLLLIIVGLALAAFLAWRWKNTAAGAEQIDRMRLRLPLLGQVWLKYQVAVFSRMMSTLLQGGLPLVPALETAGASMQSRLIANGLRAASVRVREGQPLSRSMEQTGVFPELSIEMMEVGESTGALPGMLTSVAEFYEEDVQNALTAAMSLIEPAILIVMGVVVGFVLVSLYLPIFSMGAGR